MNSTTGSHSGHGSSGSSQASTAVPGVTSAQGGYLLSPVAVPGAVDRTGTLAFRILAADGKPVTRFALSHERELHLIVVRTDGAQFRHVHPTMDSDGTWSLPWDWAAAGTYRVYTDFVPAADGAAPVTLTRTIEVAGQFTPVVPAPTNTANVDRYTVELTGDVTVGSSSELTFTVSKDGEPTSNIEPYLNAFGHLVALRDGDLAFLHVHPDGAEPAVGEVSGPEIGFVAVLPTPGRYLLYLDFQVDGKVHSAPFVVETTGTAAAEGSHSDSMHEDTKAPADTEHETDSDTVSGDGHAH